MGSRKAEHRRPLASAHHKPFSVGAGLVRGPAAHRRLPRRKRVRCVRGPPSSLRHRAHWATHGPPATAQRPAGLRVPSAAQRYHPDTGTTPPASPLGTAIRSRSFVLSRPAILSHVQARSELSEGAPATPSRYACSHYAATVKFARATAHLTRYRSNWWASVWGTLPSTRTPDSLYSSCSTTPR